MSEQPETSKIPPKVVFSDLFHFLSGIKNDAEVNRTRLLVSIANGEIDEALGNRFMKDYDTAIVIYTAILTSEVKRSTS